MTLHVTVHIELSFTLELHHVKTCLNVLDSLWHQKERLADNFLGQSCLFWNNTNGEILVFSLLNGSVETQES